MSKQNEQQKNTSNSAKSYKKQRPVAGKPAEAGRSKSARLVALDILVKVEETGAYSNLQLNRSLQQQELSRQDAALVTERVYGTISRKLTLD